MNSAANAAPDGQMLVAPQNELPVLVWRLIKPLPKPASKRRIEPPFVQALTRHSQRLADRPVGDHFATCKRVLHRHKIAGLSRRWLKPRDERRAGSGLGFSPFGQP